MTQTTKLSLKCSKIESKKSEFIGKNKDFQLLEKNKVNIHENEDLSRTQIIDKKSLEGPFAKMCQRLRNKTKKVKLYWNKNTQLIPNVFKMQIISDHEPQVIFEFNDLSLKGILLMNSAHRLNGEYMPLEGDGSGEQFTDEMNLASNILNDDHLSFSDLDFPS